jgi:ketosteroid isomerase-like protein
MSNRTQLVKEFLTAFSKADHNDFIENLLAPNFTFSAPPDPLLNRDEFFERCWSHGINLKALKYIRLIEVADEVILTHDYLTPDGLRQRNTDIFTFDGDQITRLEVYFGWAITPR